MSPPEPPRRTAFDDEEAPTAPFRAAERVGPREEMPTLIDDVALEAARRVSAPPAIEPVSAPPAIEPVADAPAKVAGVPSTYDIEVAWSHDSEPPDPAELFPKYVRILGPFTRVPVVTVPVGGLTSFSLEHRMGFIVALIDGESSIETLLDVASMPPREVLHALVTLRDLGIVSFRE